MIRNGARHVYWIGWICCSYIWSELSENFIKTRLNTQHSTIRTRFYSEYIFTESSVRPWIFALAEETKEQEHRNMCIVQLERWVVEPLSTLSEAKSWKCTLATRKRALCRSFLKELIQWSRPTKASTGSILRSFQAKVPDMVKIFVSVDIYFHQLALAHQNA